MRILSIVLGTLLLLQGVEFYSQYATEYVLPQPGVSIAGQWTQQGAREGRGCELLIMCSIDCVYCRALAMTTGSTLSAERQIPVRWLLGSPEEAALFSDSTGLPKEAMATTKAVYHGLPPRRRVLKPTATPMRVLVKAGTVIHTDHEQNLTVPDSLLPLCLRGADGT